MCSEKKELPAIYKVISYSTPRLHEGKKWFVDFFQVDPATQTLRRKKFHVDSAGGVMAKRKRANELIALLSQRLREGWNVWANVEQNREYTALTDAFDLYERFIARTVKTESYKKKTAQSYLSFLQILRQWISGCTVNITYCFQFNVTVISDFLDYVLIDREGSARTRNNYRRWLYIFCNWMLEKGYLHDNPVENIATLKEDAKYRDAIQPKEIHRMAEYLQKENPHFLLACMMEYYTMIRPGELSNIKLENIYIKEQKVFISSEFSKNRRDGMVALNDDIIKRMIELKTFDSPNDYYLFGKNFRPSADKADSRIFRDYFVKVRKALNWSDHYQFYSLKDSGIRDLANAIGIVNARDQARHTDVATTNKYLKGEDLPVNEETKHFKGAF